MRPLIPLLGLLLSQGVFADHEDDRHRDRWHKVLGDIRIQEGQTAGDVRTVNGDIEMSDHTTAGAVKTTNGRLRAGDFVAVEALATVNGSITAGQSLNVDQEARTVNGNIRIRKNSKVGHSIRTVNGSIELTDTEVGEDVRTTNGDIELNGATIVRGDIVFEEVSSSSWNQSHPTLRISSDSEVHGDIYLGREVNLRISDGAKVGEIIQQYR